MVAIKTVNLTKKIKVCSGSSSVLKAFGNTNA